MFYQYCNQKQATTILQPERPLSAIFIKRSFYKCFHISELLKTQKLVTFSMAYRQVLPRMPKKNVVTDILSFDFELFIGVSVS